MKKTKYMNFDVYSKTFVQAWYESEKNNEAIQYSMKNFAELTSSIFGCDESQQIQLGHWFITNVSNLSASERVLFAQFLRAKTDKTKASKKFLKMIQPIGDLYASIPSKYTINSPERQQHIAAALFFMNMINTGKIKNTSVTKAFLCQIEDVIECNMNPNIVGKSYEMIQARQK